MILKKPEESVVLVLMFLSILSILGGTLCVNQWRMSANLTEARTAPSFSTPINGTTAITPKPVSLTKEQWVEEHIENINLAAHVLEDREDK